MGDPARLVKGLMHANPSKRPILSDFLEGRLVLSGKYTRGDPQIGRAGEVFSFLFRSNAGALSPEELRLGGLGRAGGRAPSLGGEGEGETRNLMGATFTTVAGIYASEWRLLVTWRKSEPFSLSLFFPPFLSLLPLSISFSLSLSPI